MIAQIILPFQAFVKQAFVKLPQVFMLQAFVKVQVVIEVKAMKVIIAESKIGLPKVFWQVFW